MTDDELMAMIAEFDKVRYRRGIASRRGRESEAGGEQARQIRRQARVLMRRAVPPGCAHRRIKTERLTRMNLPPSSRRGSSDAHFPQWRSSAEGPSDAAEETACLLHAQRGGRIRRGPSVSRRAVHHAAAAKCNTTQQL